MPKREDLTTKEYWDQFYFNDRKLPIIEDLNNIAFQELSLLFNKFLPKSKEFKFVEFGCAPGSWMHFFNKYFGYKVSGVDNTKDAIIITRKNLKILKVENNSIEADIFKSQFKNDFDVVFSAGLIEHFKGERLNIVIRKHLEAVREGGYIIILIPNFFGFNYQYQKLLNRKTLDTHNLEIMGVDFFEQVQEKYNLQKVFINYVGKINFGLFVGNKWILRVGYLVQKILDFIYFKFRLSINESKFFSPYIVAIYRKK